MATSEIEVQQVPMKGLDAEALVARYQEADRAKAREQARRKRYY
jgi:hypothetical protein